MNSIRQSTNLQRRTNLSFISIKVVKSYCMLFKVSISSLYRFNLSFHWIKVILTFYYCNLVIFSFFKYLCCIPRKILLLACNLNIKRSKRREIKCIMQFILCLLIFQCFRRCRFYYTYSKVSSIITIIITLYMVSRINIIAFNF